MDRSINVLFLCTHNSARSVLAEALLNHLGRGRWRGFSAGSSPRGQVNPLAIRALAEAGISADGCTSKSWDVFAGADAPPMDVVITVCDNAAGETCPVWPGHPATAHWGYADPSAAVGDDTTRLEAFRRTLTRMRPRLEALVALPAADMERAHLEASVRKLSTI